MQVFLGCSWIILEVVMHPRTVQMAHFMALNYFCCPNKLDVALCFYLIWFSVQIPVNIFFLVNKSLKEISSFYLFCLDHCRCLCPRHKMSSLTHNVGESYYIALLPTKINNNCLTGYILWKVMCYVNFVLPKSFFT